MTTSAARPLRSFWSDGRRVERVAYVVGMLLMLSGVVHFGILAASGGSWEGPLSFRKPATFGVSFGVTLISITWVTTFLRLGERTRSVLIAALTIACVVETTLVSLQTWRGVPSHFNLETPLDSLVARTLAVGGALIVAMVAGLTFVAFRSNPHLPASVRTAIRAGFVALFASMIVGALMIARGMALVFAGHAPAAYATAGAFKLTHAVTMHGILLLPALAWGLSFLNWTERSRLRLIQLTAALYAFGAAATAAREFIRPM